MARHAFFGPADADEIIERVSAGEPLAQVCRDEHLPTLSTFYGMLAKDEELAARFGRAREAGYDQIAADTIQIADGGGPGSNSDPQRDKLRVETRLKLLAKWDPRRYGEAVQIKHAGNEGQSLRDMSESEAAARVASMLEAVRRRALPPPSEDQD